MNIIRNTESDSELLIRIAEGWAGKQSPTFDELSVSILQTHQTAQASAIHAVNQMATLRNWLIGCYIVEYEQKGRDRAKYGDRLLKRLEESVNTKGLNVTLFQISRIFYKYYPQIGDIIYATASHKLPQEQIYATPSHKFIGTGDWYLSYYAKTKEPMFIYTLLSRFKNEYNDELTVRVDGTLDDHSSFQIVMRKNSSVDSVNN